MANMVSSNCFIIDKRFFKRWIQYTLVAEIHSTGLASIIQILRSNLFYIKDLREHTDHFESKFKLF